MATPIGLAGKSLGAIAIAFDGYAVGPETMDSAQGARSRRLAETMRLLLKSIPKKTGAA
jgi:hypothetical protein